MMAGFYNRFASWIMGHVEQVKGSSNLKKMPIPISLNEDLAAYSVAGFDIRIYCHKEHNRRQYDRWFVPTENVISYRVFGVVGANAPDALKEVCEFEVNIPLKRKQYFWWVTNKNDVIKTYLDVLISRLEKPPRA